MKSEADVSKFFLVKEYYEFIRNDLTREELQNLIDIITEDIEKLEINAE